MEQEETMDGFTMRAKSDRDYLRQVDVDGYTLRTWDANKRLLVGGQYVLGYVFEAKDGSVLFTGEDFACSPMHAVDSDESLRSLLGFLTLRPGDTDADYFEGYTPEQLHFCQTDAESMQLWAMEDIGPEDGGPLEFVNLDGWTE